MNPCVVPCRNNIDLTRKAVKSILEQDIPVDLLVIDNGSSDGLGAWATRHDRLLYAYFNPPRSVAASWNFGLQYFFDMGAEYVLVVNNDIELLTSTYRRLLSDGGPFVTAVGVREWPAEFGPMSNEKRPHPDFSCYLIRRETYERVGPFDERFLIAFAEDQDYHVRLHNEGITAYCIDMPFLHHGSMTIKNANPKEIWDIKIQADKNRAYFKQKWGMAGASPEYEAYFKSTAPTERSGTAGEHSSRVGVEAASTNAPANSEID